MNACVRASVFAAAHLFAVLADVRVDLIQGTQHVKLIGVEPGLLGQVRVHILIADGGQSAYVSVVPKEGRKSLFFYFYL